jgi:hypothetical protein
MASHFDILKRLIEGQVVAVVQLDSSDWAAITAEAQRLVAAAK